MSYRIIDEPEPSGLAHVIVNPIWPFFAAMFAGSWLAFPWFVVNAVALGGQRRNLDVAIAVGGLVLNAVILWVVAGMLTSMTLDERNYAYVQLIPTGIRLAVVYVLFQRQEQAFEIFSHFGGQPKNGIFVVIAGSLLRAQVLSALPPYWQLLLS
jgi:hypothetical protein